MEILSTDVSTILQVATEHHAKPPPTTSTSLSRVIPLILATVFSSIALLIGLWANRRGKYLYRRIIVGLLLVTSILIAYSFGSTYDQYLKAIKQTCKNSNSTVLCAKTVIQIEAIFFATALGLLFIGLLFWFIASSFFTASWNDEAVIPVEKPMKHWSFGGKNSKLSTTISTQYRRELANSDKNFTDNHHQQYQQQDELAVWRDVTMFDEDMMWEDPEKKIHKHDDYYNDDFNNPLPLQQTKYHNNNPHHRQQQKHARGIHEQQARSSTHIVGPNEKQSLTPPPQVEARGYNKSRVTSSKKMQSSNHIHNNIPHRTTRKESTDSALTFGGHQHRSRRKSSGKPLLELEPTYQQQYRTTPTSMSPHPFQYSPNNTRNSSYCMTPFYDENGGGSSGGSSSSYNQDGYFQQNVPILGMPPVEHPLSKKTIKDKRIQNYLRTTKG